MAAQFSCRRWGSGVVVVVVVRRRQPPTAPRDLKTWKAPLTVFLNKAFACTPLSVLQEYRSRWNTGGVLLLVTTSAISTLLSPLLSLSFFFSHSVHWLVFFLSLSFSRSVRWRGNMRANKTKYLFISWTRCSLDPLFRKIKLQGGRHLKNYSFLFWPKQKKLVTNKNAARSDFLETWTGV